MKFLSRNLGSINNPEVVKEFIAKLDKNEGYKRNLVYAYDCYAKVFKIQWNKPVYRPSPKLPRIPLEEKINLIIANSSKKLALALSISRDTGLRPIEVMNLRLKDVDLQNGLVYPSTAKHGCARVLKLKPSTLNLLSSYLAMHPEITLESRLFGKWNSDDYGKYFRATRNRLAIKLNDLTLKTITLYSLRHHFATKLYNQTRNLLLVKELLGHRKIETTLIYTQLINNTNDEYLSAIARTVEEARRLIEEGFEYVTEMDGVKIFRRRK
ncbi:MAG: tyrosine-type recombinase/integrase [Candidatus Bathyarchaeia archaeon]